MTKRINLAWSTALLLISLCLFSLKKIKMLEKKDKINLIMVLWPLLGIISTIIIHVIKISAF